eukprot:Gb_40656 [translate_table: standard]
MRLHGGTTSTTYKCMDVVDGGRQEAQGIPTGCNAQSSHKFGTTPHLNEDSWFVYLNKSNCPDLYYLTWEEILLTLSGCFHRWWNSSSSVEGGFDGANVENVSSMKGTFRIEDSASGVFHDDWVHCKMLNIDFVSRNTRRDFQYLESLVNGESKESNLDKGSQFAYERETTAQQNESSQELDIPDDLDELYTEAQDYMRYP